jgi:hypothetical protein
MQWLFYGRESIRRIKALLGAAHLLANGDHVLLLGCKPLLAMDDLDVLHHPPVRPDGRFPLYHHYITLVESDSEWPPSLFAV